MTPSQQPQGALRCSTGFQRFISGTSDFRIILIIMIHTNIVCPIIIIFIIIIVVIIIVQPRAQEK